MICKQQRKRISALFARNENLEGSPSPSVYYVGLATGSVSDDGVITGEISGGGYARVPMPMDASTFSAPDESAVCRNLVDITFEESSTAWGNVSVIFLSRSQTGGVADYYIPISPARNIQAFTTVYFKGDPTGANGNIQLSVIN